MKDTSISQKVLFVTHKYPPSVGGMQKQSFELISNYEKIEDCSVIAFNSKYPIWLFFVLVIPRVFLKLMTDSDIKVIHGNDGLMGLFLTPFLLTNKRLFVTIHGLDIVYRINFYQWWIKNLLSRFDGIITVSQETRNECLERGLSENKVHFIANSVDPFEYNKKEKGFVAKMSQSYGVDLSTKKLIISVGRPIPRKGFSWFVSNVLPTLLPSAFYLIVGPTEENQRFYSLLHKILPNKWFTRLCQFIGVPLDSFNLSALSKDPLINDRFLLLGKLSQSDLEQLYLHADIFVMPNLHIDSDYEGFGLVAQEAVTAGALCIASNVDGIPSAIKDQHTGILLESAAIEEWTNTLNSYLADHVKLENDRKIFRKNILDKDYDWAEMSRGYYNVINEEKSKQP